MRRTRQGSTGTKARMMSVTLVSTLPLPRGLWVTTFERQQARLRRQESMLGAGETLYTIVNVDKLEMWEYGMTSDSTNCRRLLH